MVTYGIDWNKAIQAAKDKNLIDSKSPLGEVHKYPGATSNNRECMAVCALFDSGDMQVDHYYTDDLTKALDKGMLPGYYLAYHFTKCPSNLLICYFTEQDALTNIAKAYGVSYMIAYTALCTEIARLWVKEHERG